jgi:hypothetical protein
MREYDLFHVIPVHCPSPVCPFTDVWRVFPRELAKDWLGKDVETSFEKSFSLIAWHGALETV